MPAQCTYCGTRLKRGRQSSSGYSTDHLIPRAKLSRSGVSLTTAQRSMNQLPCCIACNGRKGDMDPRVWLAYIHDTKRRIAVGEILKQLPVTLIYGA